MPGRRRILAVAACTAVAGAAAGIAAALHHGGPTAPVVARHAVSTPSPTPWPSPSSTPSPTPVPAWAPGSALPRTLQASLDLHAAAAAVPLRFQAPTVGIDVPVLGVGLTSSNAVDAPKGPASSPVWDEGFWYRGGAEPGQPGVFALAGHVDRVGGASAAFWNLHRLRAGDVVTVLDQRSGTAWRYRISDTASFDMNHIDQAVLDRIYGPDVAAGHPATVPPDGVARISILTCAGTWTGSQYDHRFVAFGELVGPAPA